MSQLKPSRITDPAKDMADAFDKAAARARKQGRP